MPRRSAVTFAGGGPGFRPRPRGRSGRVRRNAMSWWPASRSSTSAPKGAVAATPTRAKSDQCDPRPQHRERLARRPVDDEHAVEVVDLVQQDARARLYELQPHVRAGLVLRLDGDRARPLDRHEDALQGEAALVLGRELLAPF